MADPFSAEPRHPMSNLPHMARGRLRQLRHPPEDQPFQAAGVRVCEQARPDFVSKAGSLMLLH